MLNVREAAAGPPGRRSRHLASPPARAVQAEAPERSSPIQFNQYASLSKANTYSIALSYSAIFWGQQQSQLLGFTSSQQTVFKSSAHPIHQLQWCLWAPCHLCLQWNAAQNGHGMGMEQVHQRSVILAWSTVLKVNLNKCIQPIAHTCKWRKLVLGVSFCLEETDMNFAVLVSPKCWYFAPETMDTLSGPINGSDNKGLWGSLNAFKLSLQLDAPNSQQTFSRPNYGTSRGWLRAVLLEQCGWRRGRRLSTSDHSRERLRRRSSSILQRRSRERLCPPPSFPSFPFPLDSPSFLANLIASSAISSRMFSVCGPNHGGFQHALPHHPPKSAMEFTRVHPVQGVCTRLTDAFPFPCLSHKTPFSCAASAGTWILSHGFSGGPSWRGNSAKATNAKTV